MQNSFWEKVDSLIQTSQVIIDRPKGSIHPRFNNIVYPLDYGYLHGTSSGDGNGIDIWKGSLDSCFCDAVICTIDVMKRDSEIKLLIGCNESEKQVVLNFHNSSQYMSGVLISRNS